MSTKKGRMIRIFPGSNTRVGFFSFYDSVLHDLDKVFLLKGGPGTGKSTLVKGIGLIMSDRGFDVELLCCSSDSNSLDGIIIPQLKVGVVDGTAPHIIEPKYPGVVEELINLGEFWDIEKLEAVKEEIIRLANQKSSSYFLAYKHLENTYTALQAQGEDRQWLSDEAIKEMVNKLGGEIFPVQKPQLRRLFAGAITPNGVVNCTKEILEGYKKKIELVGGMRKDRSRFLQQLSLLALENGYNVDIYHCFFDPDFQSMLLIPNLKLAVIDNFLPYHGELLGKEEFNEAVVLGKEESLKLFDEKISKHFQKALGELKIAKQSHEELEKHYVQAMNYEAIDQLRENLLSKILVYDTKK